MNNNLELENFAESKHSRVKWSIMTELFKTKKIWKKLPDKLRSFRMLLESTIEQTREFHRAHLNYSPPLHLVCWCGAYQDHRQRPKAELYRLFYSLYYRIDYSGRSSIVTAEERRTPRVASYTCARSWYTRCDQCLKRK